jgi:hypothetical protein
MRYSVAKEYSPTPHITNIRPADEAVKHAITFFTLLCVSALHAIQKAVNIPIATIDFCRTGKHVKRKEHFAMNIIPIVTMVPECIKIEANIFAFDASTSQCENGICAPLHRHEINKRQAGMKSLFCSCPSHISRICAKSKLFVAVTIRRIATIKSKLANLLNKKTLKDCGYEFFSRLTSMLDINPSTSTPM